MVEISEIVEYFLSYWNHIWMVYWLNENYRNYFSIGPGGFLINLKTIKTSFQYFYKFDLS